MLNTFLPTINGISGSLKNYVIMALISDKKGGTTNIAQNANVNFNSLDLLLRR